MARLTALPSRIGALPPRLAKPVDPNRAPTQRQRDDAAWRAWYKTKEWRELKAACHVRDNYTCQMCGAICAGKYPADDSPVADHRRAHRGDRKLFFDINNLQTLCKFPCHDKVKQQEEQATIHHRGVWD